MSMVMLIQSMGKGLNGQVGYASAISLVLFLLTLVPLLIVAVVNNGDTIKALASRRNVKAARRDRISASKAVAR